MNNKMITISIIFATTLLLSACGSKKNPLFLLPISSEQISEEKKGDIPLNITYNNQTQDNNQTANTIGNQNNSQNTQNSTNGGNSNNQSSGSNNQGGSTASNQGSGSNNQDGSTANNQGSGSDNQDGSTANNQGSGSDNQDDSTANNQGSGSDNQDDSTANNQGSGSDNQDDSTANNQGSGSDNQDGQNNQPLEGNANVNNTYGNGNFNFNTSITIPININISDPSGPVEGALVNVVDPSRSDTILYQGVSNEDGNVVGEVTIPSNTEEIVINIYIGNYQADPITIDVQNENNQFLQEIVVEVSFNQNVENLIASVTDSDGDGVMDSHDAYPEDPSRSARIVVPNTGVSIVAFEDLYPVPGDADSNDIVLAVVNEEDLNAEGKVVRIRGKYIFLANHAGYDLSVFINLPGSGNFKAKVSKILVDNELNLQQKEERNNVDIHLSNFQRVPIFIKHAGYFNNKNYNRRGEAFYSHHEMGNIILNSNEYPAGYLRNQGISAGVINSLGGKPVTRTHFMSEVEFILDQPIAKTDLPSAPYDLFIYVHNTGHTVHFPGFYFDNNGRDRYIYHNPGHARHKFPWVFVVPEPWNWPNNANYIGQSYPKFTQWYQNDGRIYEDWYRRDRDQNRIFPYFNLPSPIAGFLLQVYHSQNLFVWASLAILITGIVAFLFLKGRNYQIN
ncbi:MAG: LruC domain-containing protein [Leptospiraceae bacterium]|nr:LruC domain-containing protein [Leptospiraceae bacterium]MDW7975450.1 LruC domain-containing protein [Leptospiraceae bacterium]